MSLAEIVPLVLQLSVITLVFTIGLGTTPHELTELVRRAGQLLRSLAAMSLVMPIVAVVLAGLIVTLPYVNWRRKSLAETDMPIARATPAR